MPRIEPPSELTPEMTAYLTSKGWFMFDPNEHILPACNCNKKEKWPLWAKKEKAHQELWDPIEAWVFQKRMDENPGTVEVDAWSVSAWINANKERVAMDLGMFHHCVYVPEYDAILLVSEESKQKFSSQKPPA